MPQWVADVTGAFVDLLVQVFVLFLTAAGVVGLLHGDASGALFLVGGLALLALPVSRVVRGGYTLGVRGFGAVDLPVRTVSVPYFVLDVVWLALGVAWVVAPPDPDYGPGLAWTIVAVTGLLLGLRVRRRVRA